MSHSSLATTTGPVVHFLPSMRSAVVRWEWVLVLYDLDDLIVTYGMANVGFRFDGTIALHVAHQEQRGRKLCATLYELDRSKISVQDPRVFRRMPDGALWEMTHVYLPESALPPRPPPERMLKRKLSMSGNR